MNTAEYITLNDPKHGQPAPSEERIDVPDTTKPDDPDEELDRRPDPGEDDEIPPQRWDTLDPTGV